MEYQDAFTLLWEEVKQSIQEGSFAKLTMAKTIGKTELKNIFIKPISLDPSEIVSLKYHYRLKEVEDKQIELTLDKAFVILKEHLKNPFSSVILFTTEMDLHLKINKKGEGTIIENMPTFRYVTLADKDEE